MRLHRLRDQLGELFALDTRGYPLFPQDRPARLLSPHGIVSRLRAGLEAERDGLVFRAWPEEQPTPRSSLAALAAAKCARQQGLEAFRRYDLALYQAYFVECRDISQRETLVELAEAVGLERKPFLAALERDEPGAQVLAEYDEYQRRFGPLSPGIPLLELGGGRQIAGSVSLGAYQAAIAAELGV